MEPPTILVPPGAVLTIRGSPTASLRWHVGPTHQKGRAMPIEVTMSSEEQCRLMITPLTPGGQPAPVDGPAQWSVQGACTVTPIDDTSAWVVSSATIGDSTITVSVDADLGAGVVPLADTALVHVESPTAASLGLTADAPVLKP